MRTRTRKVGLWAVLVVLNALGAARIEAIECFTPRAWQPELAAAPTDADRNGIHDDLDVLEPGGLTDVVLNLNRCAEEVDLQRLEQFGEIVLVGETVSFALLRDVPVDELPALAADPQVAYVDAPSEVQPDLYITRQVVGADRVVNDLGFDGTGVGIAIIDTGVDDSVHATFPAGTYVGGIDCSISPPGCDPTSNPDDPGSFNHGTPVASIALGRGGGTCPDCIGMAPGAALIDVKVFAPSLPIQPAVLGGMNMTIKQQHAMGIDVVNMSYSNCVASDGTDIYSVMAQRIVQAGMVGVVSMGNTPNCQQSNNAQMVPAPTAADDVIAVANSWDHDTVAPSDDTIYVTSHTGPRLSDGDGDTDDELKPDLAAPGQFTLAAQADSPTLHGLHGGTSMSAPHVSGCAALVLEAKPGMPPKAVKKLLTDTALDMTGTVWDAYWGHGLLDCYNAVSTLQETEGTDLMFKTWDCKPGSPPCWTTPDLFAVNPMIEDGKPNVVTATVTNGGTIPASDFSVAIGVYDFGNGDLNYPLCTVTPGVTIPPGGQLDVTCPYTPSLTGPPPGWVSASLKAEIIYPFDTDYGNNKARHNIQIKGGPVIQLPAQLVNPTLSQLTMQLVAEESCCAERSGQTEGVCTCSGWQLDVSDNDIVMEADDCPRMVLLDLRAIDPDALREARFDVAIFGEDASGLQTPFNGFTVGARLDCEVTGIMWDGKETLVGSGAPFTACGDLYDVVRGPLPIVGGDIAVAAECFLDDEPGPSVLDRQIPDPSTGFFYLFRSGGAEPGSFNNGSQKGDRDAALAFCP